MDLATESRDLACPIFGRIQVFFLLTSSLMKSVVFLGKIAKSTGFLGLKIETPQKKTLVVDHHFPTQMAILGVSLESDTVYIYIVTYIFSTGI